MSDDRANSSAKQVAAMPEIPSDLTLSNPLLPNVIQYTPLQARGALESLPLVGKGAGRNASSHVLVPGAAHSHLLADVSNSIPESMGERDLSNPEYQATVLGVNQFLHHRWNRHGHPINRSAIAVDGTQARVHCVVVTGGVGGRAIVNSLKRVLGTGLSPVYVRTGEDKVLRYFHLQSATMPLPLAQGAVSIGSHLARHIDAKFKNQTGFGAAGNGLFRSAKDAAASTQALLLALNVSAIVVGPLYTRDSQVMVANEGWTMIAQIAEATGIPIVILLTPGAAIGLIEHSAAEPTLTSRGVYVIEPFELASLEWKNLATFVWIKYIRPDSAPPEWFVVELWRLTFGRVELAVKLGAFIAGAWAVDGRQKLTKGLLIGYACSALALEKRYLVAAADAQRGGKFSRAAVMRYADWLPLKTVLDSFPSLVRSDYWSEETNYPEEKSQLYRTRVPYGVSLRGQVPRQALPKGIEKKFEEAPA